jgi:hypothetical protein
MTCYAEGEGYVLGERSIALRLRPIDDPIVHLFLRRPERGKLGINDNVAGFEAVLAAFQMSLPDVVDDIDMVERADDRLKLRSFSASPGGSSATPSNVTVSAQAL